MTPHRGFGYRFILFLVSGFLLFMTQVRGEAPIPETPPRGTIVDIDKQPVLNPEVVREQAQELWQEGQTERATRLLDRVLSFCPCDPDAYWLRGQILWSMEKGDAAIADLRRATELAPGFTDAWGKMSRYLMLSGKFTEALEPAKQAVELAPDDYAWIINRGHSYLLQGDREKARYWYAQSIPLIPDEEALNSGPLADLDLFIDNNWQIEMARKERSRFERLGLAVIAKNHQVATQHAIADKYWNEGSELEGKRKYIAAAETYLKAAVAEKESGRVRMDDLAIELEMVGSMYEKAVQYQKAAPFYREALAAKTIALFAGEPNIPITMNSLAYILQKNGKYDQAEQLLLEILEIRMAVQPRDDSDIAHSQVALANLYMTTGRYDKAESLYRKALAIRKASLPKGHHDIASSMNWLAVLLWAVGDYDEAQHLHREGLKIRQAALPKSPFEIAQSQNNLAILLIDLGLYDEAESLLRKALAIRKATLPRGHPDIAQTLNNLAAVLDSTGRYDEAERHYRKVLELTEAALPEGHELIALSLNNLAELLRITGRYTEAEPLLRKALAIRKAALPEGHTRIAQGLNNLALLLKVARRNEQAEALFREALAINKMALPSGHPDIAQSLANLAGLLRISGRYAEAEPLYQEALLIAWGSGNPTSLSNIHSGLSDVFASREQRPLAIFFDKHAVNTLQSMRRHLTGAERATQQAFLETKEAHYKILADRLTDEGRLPEAQQVLEMLKSAEYMEFTRQSIAAYKQLKPIALDAFESRHFKHLEYTAMSLREVYGELRNLRQIHPKVRTINEQARVLELERQQKNLGKQFMRGFTEVRTAFGQIQEAEQQRLTAQHQRMGIDRRLLIAKFDQAMLVQYVVLEEQLLILITTPSSIETKSYKIKAEKLNKQIADYYQRLKRPDLDPRLLSHELFKVLLSPIADLLEDYDPRLLMFSLDGMLRYIPMSSLFDGKRYLIERTTVTLFAETDSEQLLLSPQPQWRVAGFGVSQAHGNFSSLPAVLDGAAIAAGEKRGPRPHVLSTT